jgi:hypothetical protein
MLKNRALEFLPNYWRRKRLKCRSSERKKNVRGNNSKKTNSSSNNSGVEMAVNYRQFPNLATVVGIIEGTILGGITIEGLYRRLHLLRLDTLDHVLDQSAQYIGQVWMNSDV